MITSFFRTSKPLHYLIFLVLFFAIFVFQSFYNHNINQSPISYFTLFGVFFLFLATFFVYVFIITKNDLTQKKQFCCTLSLLVYWNHTAVFFNTYCNAIQSFCFIRPKTNIQLKEKSKYKKKAI